MHRFLLLYMLFTFLQPSKTLRLLVATHGRPSPLLDIIPRIRPSRSTHLLFCHGILDLLDIDQLLYPHDLTSNGLCDGVVDGRHSFAQSERFQDALCLCGHANARAHERYPEVRHDLYIGEEVWEVEATVANGADLMEVMAARTSGRILST